MGLGAPAFAACARPADEKARIGQALADINAYRKSAGLAALSTDGKLTKAAKAHACDMAAMGKHSHVGSNGSDLVKRLRSAGYKFRSANENVGKFGKSNAAQWWYNSSGHRANMLSPKIRDVGLAVALGPDNQFYWVMVGGSSK